MKNRIKPSTTQMIMLSFLFAILIGSVLLSLPISALDGESVPYIDALFTATTATCVTGLVTLPTFGTWSFFGQAVILLLIQIGGLGIITVLASITVALNKRMGLKDSQLIADAFNLSSFDGLSGFIKKVIIGTLIVEGIGALLYMPVFVRDFGARGIWISIFNSISAFCNAGIDVFAANSLSDYATDPVINTVTCLLIILGGLGYIVWWDIIRAIKDFKVKRFRCLNTLTLHSKIVLSATAILIFIGAAIIFVFEYSNPLTIGKMSLPNKIMASVFQSVTTRTAGFFTIPQEHLTNGSALTSIILMFVGGSPVGTAGGIKTVTLAVLLVTAYAVITNKNNVDVFGRRLSKHITRKAVAVGMMSLSITVISTLLLCAVTDASFIDILYETVSATATVGLTRALTPLLNVWGKLVIICTMYLGRIGPISLAIAFSYSKKKENIIKNPVEDISVG